MTETHRNDTARVFFSRHKVAYAALAMSLLTLVLLWMLGLIGPEKTKPGQTPLVEKPFMTTRTARVERQTVEDILSWPGTVRARSETRIAPKISARILEINVHAGDRVKKGDVLARLDPNENQAIEREAASVVAAARAEAIRAQADFQRTKSLFEQQAATRETFDHAMAESNRTKASLDAAEYHFRQARIEKNETALRAPFDGVVVSRLHEPGDMGMAGDPIVSLFSASDLRLEAAMPAACKDRIELGSSVAVRIDTINATITGMLDEIVPSADPQTGNILVKASLPDTPGLQPGLFGWLKQACGSRSVLLIPIAALRRIGQIEIVTAISGGQSMVRHVRSGPVQGDQIEILSGLDAGETVALP